MTSRFLKFLRGNTVAITMEAFLIDRQSIGLARKTLKFYQQYINHFSSYCDANSLTLIQQINPDVLRRYFLAFARTLRSYFRWLTIEEVMPPQWKNPLLNWKMWKISDGIYGAENKTDPKILYAIT